MSWANESTKCHLCTALALAAAAVLTAAPAYFDPDDAPVPPAPGSIVGPAAPGPPGLRECARTTLRPCWSPPRFGGVHKEANST
jgi:hypothetical protein